MRVAVTGTPGTGKTTATERLDSELAVIHLNDVVAKEGFVTGRDEARDTLIVDEDGVREWLEANAPGDVVIESHLAHHFEADRVVVLRAHPETIESRLLARGESEATAEENAESEALDLILAEAVERHGEGSVYEIDTTGEDPDEVSSAIDAVIRGEREPSVGTVSFVEYLSDRSEQP